MKIQGLVSLITGGCSGLGLSTAKHLILQGGKVILLDKNDQAGSKCEQELGKENARFIACDVREEDDVKRAYQEGNKMFGGVRTYVHCAGICSNYPILQENGGVHSSEIFMNFINTNLYGSFLSTKFAAWHLKDQPVQGEQRGLIINTSSIFAYHGAAGFAAYGASKGGLEGMLMPIARELGAYKIRVVNIVPGMFMTPLFDHYPKEAVEGMAKFAIRGKHGKGEHYAKLVQSIIENEHLNATSIELHDGMVFPNI